MSNINPAKQIQEPSQNETSQTNPTSTEELSIPQAQPQPVSIEKESIPPEQYDFDAERRKQRQLRNARERRPRASTSASTSSDAQLKVQRRTGATDVHDSSANIGAASNAGVDMILWQGNISTPELHQPTGTNVQDRIQLQNLVNMAQSQRTTTPRDDLQYTIKLRNWRPAPICPPTAPCLFRTGLCGHLVCFIHKRWVSEWNEAFQGIRMTETEFHAAWQTAQKCYAAGNCVHGSGRFFSESSNV